MNTKTVTIGQFLDAVEQNGLNQTFDHLFDFDDKGRIIAACAVGQAHINLGIGTIRDADYRWANFASFITGQNDYRHESLPVIADAAREMYKDYLDEEYEFNIKDHIIAPGARK